MKAKPQDHVLIKKLYDALFLNLSRTVKLSLFFICFSASLNIPSKLKSGINPFSTALAETTALSKAQAVWKIQIEQLGNGSGFFISENKIVTNYHVIAEAESIGLENIILTQEGNQEQFKVKRIVSMSILKDLAVLEIEGAVFNFLNLQEEDLTSFSKNLYILGYPRGQFQKIRQRGSVFNKEGFFADHSILNGTSGSPVFNESHQLTGIAAQQHKNLLFFISLKTLKTFIESEHFLCKSLNVKECFRSSKEIFEKSKQEVKKAKDYLRIAYKYISESVDKSDLLLGIEWLKKSAGQDYPPAQHWLAIMYYNGEASDQETKFYHLLKQWLGMDKLSLTIKWLKKSAGQDYPPAQHSLAVMYYNGEGVKKNEPLAIKLLKQSAGQGYIPSINTLADLGIDVSASDLLNLPAED